MARLRQIYTVFLVCERHAVIRAGRLSIHHFFGVSLANLALKRAAKLGFVFACGQANKCRPTPVAVNVSEQQSLS